MWSLKHIVVLSLTAATLVGCEGSFFRGTGRPPGEWNVDDIHCGKDSDCAEREACLTKEGAPVTSGADGICQIPLCKPTEASRPPLGQVGLISPNRELVVVEGATLSAYKVSAGDVSFAANPAATGTGTPAGITGGNFTGKHPEAIATAWPGSIQIGDVPKQLSFDPAGIAAGDIDGDGFDDVVAIASVENGVGQIAVCSPKPNAPCKYYDISGALGYKKRPQGFSVAVGNLDDDRALEAVLLTADPALYDNGTAVIKDVVIIKFPAQDGDQPSVTKISGRSTSNSFGGITSCDLDGASRCAFSSVAVGDLDGDGKGEVALYENPGFAAGITSYDRVHFYSYTMATLLPILNVDVAKTTADILLADTDGDGKAELLTLTKYPDLISTFCSYTPWSGQCTNYLERYVITKDPATEAWSSKQDLSRPLSKSYHATHLAVADVDGDAVYGRLVAGPVPIRGRIVPLIVSSYPPYSRTRAEGGSTIILGKTDSSSETDTNSAMFRNTLQLIGKAGVDIGAGSVGPYFSGLWNRIVSRSTSHTLSQSDTIRVFASARPEQDGPSNGEIAIGVGCYDSYAYQIEDPAGRSTNSTFVVNVPTQAITASWSLRRYNALAKALGNLPVVDIASRVGDLSSYPRRMLKLDGKTPVPSKDMVFQHLDKYEVSDSGQTQVALTSGKNTSDSGSLDTSFTTWAGLSIGFPTLGLLKPGFTAEYDLQEGTGRGYSMNIGQEYYFGGTVPPIRNDPRTPEDEFQLYRFSFTPYVYKEHAKVDGADTSYYVMNYVMLAGSKQ